MSIGYTFKNFLEIESPTLSQDASHLGSIRELKKIKKIKKKSSQHDKQSKTNKQTTFLKILILKDTLIFKDIGKNPLKNR